MQVNTSRTSSTVRWINITLRTVHLFGVAGVGGAYLYQVPEEEWIPYLLLVVFSGAGMLLLDVLGDYRIVFQVRGMATVLKVLLVLTSAIIGTNASILVVIILISGVISHAPGKIRYYTLVKVQP